MGFPRVESGPLVRSSYHARRALETRRRARSGGTARRRGRSLSRARRLDRRYLRRVLGASSGLAARRRIAAPAHAQKRRSIRRACSRASDRATSSSIGPHRHARAELRPILRVLRRRTTGFVEPGGRGGHAPGSSVRRCGTESRSRSSPTSACGFACEGEKRGDDPARRSSATSRSSRPTRPARQTAPEGFPIRRGGTRAARRGVARPAAQRASAGRIARAGGGGLPERQARRDLPAAGRGARPAPTRGRRSRSSPGSDRDWEDGRLDAALHGGRRARRRRVSSGSRATPSTSTSSCPRREGGPASAAAIPGTAALPRAPRRTAAARGLGLAARRAPPPVRGNSCAGLARCPRPVQRSSPRRCRATFAAARHLGRLPAEVVVDRDGKPRRGGDTDGATSGDARPVRGGDTRARALQTPAPSRTIRRRSGFPCACRSAAPPPYVETAHAAAGVVDLRGRGPVPRGAHWQLRDSVPG